MAMQADVAAVACETSGDPDFLAAFSTLSLFLTGPMAGQFADMRCKDYAVRFDLLADGDTNKQIAAQLHISEHTVKSHIIHIFNKLGVSDRTQASVWAAIHGLVPSPHICD